MRLCKGMKCPMKNLCLYNKNMNNVKPTDERDFSEIYENSCPHFRYYRQYEFNNLKLLTAQDIDVQSDKASQHIEIFLQDFNSVAQALMKAGYQVLSYQDGESENIVMIDYIHPKYDGKTFVEVE